MSEMMPESQGVPDSISQGFEQTQGTGDGSGGNPAWNDLLSVVPEELHSQVTPHLQNWDKKVNQRFQSVQSRYKDYDPFVESGVTPEEINFGLGLANAIATNPLEVLQALQEYTQAEEQQNNQVPGQGQTTPNSTPAEDPRLSQMEQMMRVMAQNMLTEKEQREQEAIDQAFEAELDSLQEKYKDQGGFDEDYVTALLYANEEMETEDAVKAYFNKVNEIRSQQRRPGPNVLGAGGAVPNRDIQVEKLDQKGTRGLAAQMLQDFFQE